MSELRTTRQKLVVWLDGSDEPLEVVTRPIDHHMYATTRAKHGWPTAADDPMGYLMFLGWAGARRLGLIATGLTWESFLESVQDVAEAEAEPLRPTPSAPGAD